MSTWTHAGTFLALHGRTRALTSGASRVELVIFTVGGSNLFKTRVHYSPAAKVDVRELRAHLQLSREKFAHEIGVTAQTVYRWEKSLSEPSPLALSRIQGICEGLSDQNREG